MASAHSYRSDQGPEDRRSQIEALLRKRGYHLLSEAVDNSQATATARLSFDNPHSCEHCQKEAVRVKEALPTYTCWDCGQKGAGVPVPTDPNMRSCEGCGRRTAAMPTASYRATLRYGLADAVEAALSGCVFYHYLFRGLGSVRFLAQQLARYYDGDMNTMESIIDELRLQLSGSSNLTDSNTVCFLRTHFGALSAVKDGLYGWTTADDWAARYVNARPYESDVDSVASWNFARRCFETCKTEHSRCRSRLTDLTNDRWRGFAPPELGLELTNIGDVPSRLLRVDPNSSIIRLVDVRDMDEEELELLRTSGFAILSYCWGRQQYFTLTAEKDEDLRFGFPETELYKTIRDATRTVRQLGLPYLWVDALCIYQDSDADKSVELSRMATYYTSASVTICASVASDCNQGFLHNREDATTGSYSVGPIRIALRSEDDTEGGHLYFVNESDPPKQPTTTRGWTMQESLLSRRLLIYETRQLYWSCANASAGCGGMNRIPEDRYSGNEVSLVLDIYPIGDLLIRTARNMWQALLRDYTERQIGVPGDKLPAVSALVTHMVGLGEIRGEVFDYVAGMPISRGDDMAWPTQLLWYPVDLGLTTRPEIYRAPSWSWAVVDGPVLPNVDESGLTSITPSSSGRWVGVASVEEHAFELVYPNVPYGAVSSGHLRIRAKIRRLSECVDAIMSEFPIRIRTANRSVHTMSTDLSSRMDLLPDTTEDANSINNAFTNSPDEGHRSEIYLLLLQTHANVRGNLGLIVSTCNDTQNALRRIGVFFSQQREPSDMVDASTLFDNCATESIHLI